MEKHVHQVDLKKDFAIDVNFYKGGNKKVFCINLEQIGRKLKNSILIW